jgi:c-di-GMP-binding flagellar brake protein YcgR
MASPNLAPAHEELRVATTAEIAGFLHELQREDARIALSNPQGLSLTTRICAFNPGANLLGLEVGASQDAVGQALVASQEITAVAFLGSIKLQFELESPVLVTGENGSVLRSAVPERMYRFQRRQAFRVQPAGTLYPRVLFPQPGDLAHGMPPRALRVLDISIGGLALQLPADFSPLVEGEARDSLILELDRGTPLRVGLRAQHVSALMGEPGALQLGCAFLALDSAVERALQVYVDQTQKRRRLLKLTP